MNENYIMIVLMIESVIFFISAGCRAEAGVHPLFEQIFLRFIKRRKYEPSVEYLIFNITMASEHVRLNDILQSCN